MNNQIISFRQIQRNYRQLINRAKQTGQPVFLGARLKKEAVLMDYDSYEYIKAKADQTKQSWAEVKVTLANIRYGGKTQSLSNFIYEDRHKH